ncbi:MAG: WG repeat-containing protein [Anaeromyxobacteraceae bacterium]
MHWRKGWLLAIVAVVAGAPARGADGGQGPLFPVRQGGKWGYVDRAGRVVVAPRFEAAARFSEGLAAVVLEGKHCYVDVTGRVVLAPEQEPAGPHHRSFASGRAAVRSGAAIGFIDRSGKLAIPARFTSADDFSEGLAFACAERGCGYVDRAGTPVSPALLGAAPLRDGIAGVWIGKGKMTGKRYALYDARRGVLPGDYESVGRMSEGLVAVRYQGRWGYVDRTGRGVIRPQFSGAGEFSDGLAPVSEQAWTCGYLDRTGKLAIPARFRLCYPFSSGRARVEILGEDPKVPLPAFIDRTGRVVFEGAAATPPFESAEDFVDGLAAVEAAGSAGGKKLGYVDADGRYVWPPTE